MQCGNLRRMGNKKCIEAKEHDDRKRRTFTPSGETMLTAIVQDQLWEALDLFLQNSDPNVPNMYSETPLMLATRQNNYEIVVKLVERGADVDAKDTLGKTALHIACLKQCTEIGCYLLTKGADPTGGSVNLGKMSLRMQLATSTPLTLAVDSNSFELVTALLKFGANPNQCDSLWENTAFIKVCQKGCIKLFQAFQPYLAQIDLNHENKSGQTALDRCVEGGNCDGVDILLDHHNHGQIISEPAKLQALIASISANCRRCFHRLLESGANIHGTVTNSQHSTPLQYALTTKVTDGFYISDSAVKLSEKRLAFAVKLLLLGANISSQWHVIIAVPVPYSSSFLGDLEFVYILCIMAYGIQQNDKQSYSIAKLSGLFKSLALNSFDRALMLLCEAGYDPNEIDVVLTKNRTKNATNCPSGEALSLELSNISRNVRTLTNLSVLSIRQTLSLNEGNVLHKTQQLDIPRTMKDMITLGPCPSTWAGI